MKRLVHPVLLVFLLAPPAHGGEPGFEDEVAHLLGVIEQSHCTFIRNESTYSAAEARAHIARKYDSIKARISSAEQFITYGASRSSITGKRYAVDCDGVRIESGQWLRNELEAYRQGHAASSPAPGAETR